MGAAFYVPDGPRFVSTDLTRGPWSPKDQHAGPPSALLGRAVESLGEGQDFSVARMTVELLRGVPVAPLRVEARVVRPGRRVQLAEAVLRDDGGAEVAFARAWLIRRGDTGAEQTAAEPPPFAGPDEARQLDQFNPWGGDSYFTAIEWRCAAGAFLEPGPATMWMRMRTALVDGETPSPLTRVLAAADSGNGISMELDLSTHLFINTELSVHLFREPVGEWVCLDARTRIGPSGAGLATSALYDASGRIGEGNQALLIAPLDR